MRRGKLPRRWRCPPGIHTVSGTVQGARYARRKNRFASGDFGNDSDFASNCSFWFPIRYEMLVKWLNKVTSGLRSKGSADRRRPDFRRHSCRVITLLHIGGRPFPRPDFLFAPAAREERAGMTAMAAAIVVDLCRI